MDNIKGVKKRQAYAVQTGDYVGQMFIVCEITNQDIGCLSIPIMENVLVPKSKWSLGSESNIIEYVENISRDVFKVCVVQYNKNKDSIS